MSMKEQRKSKQHNKRKQTVPLSTSNQKGYTTTAQLSNFKESWERRKKERKKNPSSSPLSSRSRQQNVHYDTASSSCQCSKGQVGPYLLLVCYAQHIFCFFLQQLQNIFSVLSQNGLNLSKAHFSIAPCNATAHM